MLGCRGRRCCRLKLWLMTVWEIAPGVVDQFTALGRIRGPDIRFPSHITTTTDIFWTETVYKNRLEYSERVVLVTCKHSACTQHGVSRTQTPPQYLQM